MCPGSASAGLKTRPAIPAISCRARKSRRLRYAPGMPFDLVINAPDGDIVLGSYQTRTAAEKMAAIAVPPGERWSVVEVAGEGDARPAAVLDFASYQAKRRARRLKD